TDEQHCFLNCITLAAANTRYYSAGFTNQSPMIGSSYSVPSPITEPILDLPNATIVFTGGNLSLGFTNAISIGRSSRVANQSPNSLSMTFSISTGTFRGNVVDPVSSRTMPFGGVVLQKDVVGYGILFGADQTSGVLLGL